jgi:hypothetical protein
MWTVPWNPASVHIGTKVINLQLIIQMISSEIIELAYNNHCIHHHGSRK